MTQSALDSAIAMFGGGYKGVQAIANACERTPQTIYFWRKTGEVPTRHCLTIEDITNGQITRQQLRPDIFN